MSDATQEIRATLERRIADIDDEAGGLQRALSHLVGGTSKARRPARKRRRTKPRARRGARSAQFLEIVDAEPGIRGAALAEKMGVVPSQVYGLASRLEAQGKIKKVDSGYQLKA
jgi:hypothetical protein